MSVYAVRAKGSQKTVWYLIWQVASLLSAPDSLSWRAIVFLSPSPSLFLCIPLPWELRFPQGNRGNWLQQPTGNILLHISSGASWLFPQLSYCE
jgi:hypothetical protein